MLIKIASLTLLGLASGLTISTGVFAFIISIGVLPRLAGKTRTTSQIILYENCVFLGGMFGNIMSIFHIQISLGVPVLIMYGVSAGIFTGCLAIAIAEILDAFPIMFRRLKVSIGMSYLMIAMAFGKMLGSFYFFVKRL